MHNTFYQHPVCELCCRKNINHRRTSWPSKCQGDVTLCFSVCFQCTFFQITSKRTTNICYRVCVCVYVCLPGFGTQCFDFVFFNELTASELLYLSVQVTDVPHCHTHRESSSHTIWSHTHTPLLSLSHTQDAQKKTDTLSLSVFPSSPLRAREHTVTTRSLSTEIHRGCSAAARQAAVMKIFRIRSCEDKKHKVKPPLLFFFLFFFQLNFWASVCRMIYVQCIFFTCICWEWITSVCWTHFKEAVLQAWFVTSQPKTAPVYNLHKHVMESWSHHFTYTENGLSLHFTTNKVVK